MKSISGIALSPDGTRVAWSVEGPRSGTELVFIGNTNRPTLPVRITVGDGEQSCYEHEPAWSSDGKQLAFLSDCRTAHQAQLFVQDFAQKVTNAAAHSGPRQLTHVDGSLSHLQWAPDDQRIALLFTERATREQNPEAAENRAVGVIDDLRNTDVQRLSVTQVSTGSLRVISPPGLYVFEYDWAPNSQQFVFTAAPPPGDDNWYIAQLYTQAGFDTPPVSIYRPALQIALPRFSPDGKSIAFIAGLMSDQGGTGGEIFAIPTSGGKARNLTRGCNATPAWFTWLSDREMLFTEFSGGSTAIGSLNVSTAAATRLWLGDETIGSGGAETSLSVGGQGKSLQTALFRLAWSMLPEVWVGPPGHWTKLTAINQAASQNIDQRDVRSRNVTWKNGRFPVQGWLLYPSNYDPSHQYPMLVAVHGGPAWITTPDFQQPDFDTALFTHFGYFVFFPNPRGSYGQGEMFTQANRRDWGFGDLQDIVSGVDAVAQSEPVDPHRVGLLGWSYGGSTAMMAITQTGRFRAAVAGAGAANWLSYYGQNSIDKWMIPYFGASAYQDPAAYARCSAMTYIRKAKTPTLVLVGERDGEAPPAQSLEFWHALKELGVPTQLVIYADEGHSFFKESDRIDVIARTLEWFNCYLEPQ